MKKWVKYGLIGASMGFVLFLLALLSLRICMIPGDEFCILSDKILLLSYPTFFIIQKAPFVKQTLNFFISMSINGFLIGGLIGWSASKLEKRFGKKIFLIFMSVIMIILFVLFLILLLLPKQTKYEFTKCLDGSGGALDLCEKKYDTNISVNNLEDAKKAALIYLEYLDQDYLPAEEESIGWIGYFNESAPFWKNHEVRYEDGSYFWFVQPKSESFFHISKNGEIFWIRHFYYV